MKEAGAKTLISVLGAQFIPDWLDEENLVTIIFETMLTAAVDGSTAGGG